MDATVSQITSLTIVYSTVYSGADQRKHKFPTQRASDAEMFPFDDIIMQQEINDIFAGLLAGQAGCNRLYKPIVIETKWPDILPTS